METIDSSSGVLLPYYDYDTRIMFLAGKVMLTDGLNWQSPLVLIDVYRVDWIATNILIFESI